LNEENDSGGYLSKVRKTFSQGKIVEGVSNQREKGNLIAVLGTSENPGATRQKRGVGRR